MEISIDLKTEFAFEKFKNSLARKWLDFGNPIDEILCSDNMDDVGMPKEINMFHIIFSEL